MQRLTRWLSGEGFPIFAIALLALYEALMAVVLLLPAQGTPLEAFAEDFRVWCYGLDPATGRFQWAYVVSMLTPPWLMGGFIALMWDEPLRAARKQPFAALRHVVPAVVLIGAAAVALVRSVDTSGGEGELPFPAEALRTHQAAPDLVLTDHTGAPVDLRDERGHVVVLTAVYAHCVSTCPVILTQIKAAVAALPEAARQDLRVIGVTLDPERDDPAKLAALVEGHGLEAPLFRLATGEVAEVERVLDDLGVARQRDPETGVIDHANLFVVVDRSGEVAYRFSIGERQQRWLTTALGLLLAEGPDDGA